jgi:crossover junction endodeoxyribonuclease RuvC
VRVLGIDPGSQRTGYGCVDSDGRRHRLVGCGAIRAAAGSGFPERLATIHRELTAVIRDCTPECIAIENLFYASNVRSALLLGHARGVAIVAAVEAGLPVIEYTPAEIKRAVVGYGRAEKIQVQRMMKLLLGLDRMPSPHDAADALAVAVCHVHAIGRGLPAASATSPSRSGSGRGATARGPAASLRSWRQYRPPGSLSRA